MSGHAPHDDAAWQSLLRSNTTQPPVDDVDWTALHSRIATEAAPLLDRRVASWWQLLGSRPSQAPRMLAAAAVITLLLAGALMPERPAPVAALEYRTIEEELAGDMLDGSIPLLAGDADTDDVLHSLLLYDVEEQ